MIPSDGGDEAGGGHGGVNASVTPSPSKPPSLQDISLSLKNIGVLLQNISVWLQNAFNGIIAGLKEIASGSEKGKNFLWVLLILVGVFVVVKRRRGG